VNTVAWAYGSTQALPFGTVVMLIAVWILGNCTLHAYIHTVIIIHTYSHYHYRSITHTYNHNHYHTLMEQLSQNISSTCRGDNVDIKCTTATTTATTTTTTSTTTTTTTTNMSWV